MEYANNHVLQVNTLIQPLQLVMTALSHAVLARTTVTALAAFLTTFFTLHTASPDALKDIILLTTPVFPAVQLVWYAPLLLSVFNAHQVT